MIKRILCLLTVFTMFFVLSACEKVDNSNSDDSSKSGESNSENKEGKTIKLAHVQGEWTWPMLEEVVAEYKKVSGNTVELLYVPAEGIGDWATTQFVGGTAPDILWATGLAAHDFYKNEWILDIKDYYDGESPYTKKAWKDSFYDGVLKGVIDPNGTGALIGMPISITTVNMYYNTKIMEDIGVDADKLESWTDIYETAKKVKKEKPDTIPFSVQNSMRWNFGWMESFMMESLWYDVVEKLDIIDKDDVLQLNEQIAGIKAGIMDPADSRMVDYFRFMKEFSGYFNNGFNSASWEYEALFNEGKSAMTINGSWFPNQVLQNELDVNYSIGPMPYVDSAISGKSENRLRKYATGRGGADVMVTKKAKDNGVVDVALDFMMFLTDPNTGAKMLCEKLMWIPVVQNVTVPKEMEGLTKFLGEDNQQVSYFMNRITPEQTSKYDVMFADFLVNKASAEDFAKDFKALVLAACDDAIAENPEWNIDKYIKQLNG